MPDLNLDEIRAMSEQALFWVRSGQPAYVPSVLLTVGAVPKLLAELEYRNNLLAKANEVLTETRVSLQLTETERRNCVDAVQEQRSTIAELRAQLAVVEGERDDALLTINELTAPAAVPTARGPHGVGPYLLTDKARNALGEG